jgi:hypothetical protein
MRHVSKTLGLVMLVTLLLPVFATCVSTSHFSATHSAPTGCHHREKPSAPVTHICCESGQSSAILQIPVPTGPMLQVNALCRDLRESTATPDLTSDARLEASSFDPPTRLPLLI